MSQTPPQETVKTGVTGEAEKEPEKKRISVFNLPPGITTKDDLRELCKPFGSVTDVEYIPTQGTRASFGFVTFRTEADASYAIYRLNHSNMGGKLPLKARFPPERKNNATAPGEKKKVKKAIQPLSLLTPKVPIASTAQQQQQNQQQDGFTKKAGWDLPPPAPQPTQQHNNPPNRRPPKAKQFNAKNDQNNHYNPPQHVQQNPPVQTHAAPSHPQQTHVAPQQTHVAPQQTHLTNVQQNHSSPQQSHPAAAPNHPTPQQSHPAAASQQPANPRIGGTKKQPRQKINKVAFQVTVSDPKTGLPLHVIDLTKGQYDKHILPLVVKPQ